MPFAWVVLSHGIPLFLVIPHSHVIPRYDAVLHVIPRYDAVSRKYPPMDPASWCGVTRCDAESRNTHHVIPRYDAVSRNTGKGNTHKRHFSGPRIAVRGDPV